MARRKSSTYTDLDDSGDGLFGSGSTPSDGGSYDEYNSDPLGIDSDEEKKRKGFTETVIKHKDTLALLYSILGGIAGLALAITVYSLFISSMEGTNTTLAGMLLIGLISSLTAVVSYFGITLYSKTKINRHEVRWYAIPLALVCIFAAGCAMQYLYSMEVKKAEPVSTVDDYVFVVDDSGSMKFSDHDNKRITAMEQLLRSLGPKQRAAVILFGTSVSHAENFEKVYGKVDETLKRWADNVKSDGITNFKPAYQAILAIPEIMDSKRTTQIIFLTDGAFTDGVIDVDEIAEQCKKGNITVSSIELGDFGKSSNQANLRLLTEATGGSHVAVDDAEQLASAYTDIGVMIENDERNLASARKGDYEGSLLLMMIRIAAWGAIGLLYMLFLEMMMHESLHRLQPLVNIAAGLTVGVILEVLGRTVPDFLIWKVNFGVVFMPLICIVLFSYKEKKIEYAERKQDPGRQPPKPISAA